MDFLSREQNLNKTCIQSGESFILAAGSDCLTHLATMGSMDPPTLAGVSEGGVVAEPPDTGAEVRVDWVEADPGLPPVHHQPPFSTTTTALI